MHSPKHRKCLICLEIVQSGVGLCQGQSNGKTGPNPLISLLSRGGRGPGVTSATMSAMNDLQPLSFADFFFRHATPLFLDVARKELLKLVKQQTNARSYF